MNPNKAFRKFGEACMNAPPGSHLNVGLVWIEQKGWRVMMNVHTAVLHLESGGARSLADVYGRQHQTTHLAWVAPTLRRLADEADQKNRAGLLGLPPQFE
jgi:hypothetical protein